MVDRSLRNGMKNGLIKDFILINQSLVRLQGIIHVFILLDIGINCFLIEYMIRFEGFLRTLEGFRVD